MTPEDEAGQLLLAGQVVTQMAERALRRVAELEAERDRLREALSPFATALKGNWSHQPDNMVIVAGTPTDLRFAFLLRDFRLAREALKENSDD